MNAVMQTTDPEIIQQLPLDMVQLDPDQPRQIFDQQLLDELAADIKARGVIQPITTRPNGDDEKQIIVYGERRYRAAQLAGLETIPAICTAGYREPVDRLIDQVAENLQRDDLKPMEMAAFFDSLYNDHKVKIKDIPALLEARGLKSMERSYISNMRRLLGLPQWAQDMINVGTLTPSHGKHILSVIDYEQILADLQTEIESDISNRGVAPTVHNLEHEIHRQFAMNYRDITKTWGDEAPQFDIETCKDCTTCKSIKPHYSNKKDIFCLDDACYDKKQQATKESALLRQLDAQEEARCETESPAKVAQAAGRIERTQLYLDQWLRTQLAEHLADDEATLYAILLWLGAGAPGNWGAIDHPDFWNRDDDMQNHGINITLKHKLDHGELLLDIVKHALASMNRENLRWLAHHCGTFLEGVYLIDREYLSIKTKAELIECATPIMQDRRDEWGKDCKLPGAALVDLIEGYDTEYGIPADLAEYYEASKPTEETD